MVKFFEENEIEPECVLDEGGIIMDSPIAGINGRYAVIGIAEKGYGDVKFTAKGSGGHSSTPPKNTPVARLAKFIARLETKSPFKRKLSKPVREMLGAMAPYMGFGMRLVMGNLWLFGGLLKKALPLFGTEGAAMIKTSCVFTVLSGSNSSNVIPQEATAIANLRFMPFQNLDETLALLRRIAIKYDIETEFITGNAATPVTDVNGKIFKSLRGIAQACFPEAGVGPYVMFGGTDSQNYSGICKNIIRFAPFYVDDQQYKSIHANDENIYIESLAKGVVFFKSLIENLE
jgi:carboxypeptidase PM20D1